MSQQLTVFNSRLGHKQVAKTTVEAEAREAASSGAAIADSCRYPYTSEAGMHFKAVYLLSRSRPEQKEHTRD